MSRSGADYVYASRLLHPLVGAFVGFGLMLTYFNYTAAGMVLISQLFLPQLVWTLGHATNSTSIVSFSNTLASSHWWQLGVALFVLAGALILATRGGRAAGRAIWWLFLAGVAAIALLVIESLTHSHSSFQSAYNAATIPGAYHHVLAAGKATGIQTGNSLSNIALVLPFITLYYIGYTQSSFSAGEIKRPATTYIRATLITLAAAAAMMVVAWLALKHLTGLTFFQTASNLAQGNPTAWQHATGAAPFTGMFYGTLLGSPVVRVAIAVGFILCQTTNPISNSFVTSRVIFALAFDRLLPTRVADVNERTNRPFNAALFTAGIVLIFIVLSIFSTGFTRAYRNALLMTLAIFFVTSLGAAILPFRRRDLYDSSPKLMSWRLGGVPGITIIAVLSMIVSGGLFYESATHSAISAGYDAGSVITLTAMGVAGVVAYVVSRIYLMRKKGVDLDLALRELPPE
jgi:amino acid transporter